MLWAVNIIVFITSGILLYFSGEIIVNSLMRFSKALGLKEFVVAFFVMAFAASLPNLFVGITSAIKGVPELSFGDILGNNLIALTLAVGAGIFFSRENQIPAQSKTIQTTSLFTITGAILPLVLVSDGVLGRWDGLALIGLFIFYVFWLFSKKERFEKIYEEEKNIKRELKSVFIDVGKIFMGVVLLLISANGIVASASFIAVSLNLSMMLVGILIVGLGSALPEVYFSISSARKDESYMIMGNLMGAVIIPATLVLGIVALIEPIKTDSIDLFFVSRIFLIGSALFFFFFTKTDRMITKKEGYFLLAIYFSFVATILFLS